MENQNHSGDALPSHDLLADCFKQGRDAADHNKQVFRQRHSGTPRANPYLQGSDEHKRWNDGYHYQDMVNDG